MYRVRRAAKITLTKHISTVAGQFANNMTLFETTGIGGFLITDQKSNLHQLFDVGKEIVAYQDSRECVELIRYYLEHEDERASIARAGQQRTLRDHTYHQRMQELVDIIHRYL